jgi:hypothetical protein
MRQCGLEKSQKSVVIFLASLNEAQKTSGARVKKVIREKSLEFLALALQRGLEVSHILTLTIN